MGGKRFQQLSLDDIKEVLLKADLLTDPEADLEQVSSEELHIRWKQARNIIRCRSARHAKASKRAERNTLAGAHESNFYRFSVEFNDPQSFPNKVFEIKKTRTWAALFDLVNKEYSAEFTFIAVCTAKVKQMAASRRRSRRCDTCGPVDKDEITYCDGSGDTACYGCISSYMCTVSTVWIAVEVTDPTLHAGYYEELHHVFFVVMSIIRAPEIHYVPHESPWGDCDGFATKMTVVHFAQHLRGNRSVLDSGLYELVLTLDNGQIQVLPCNVFRGVC